ncbi:MAG TPA: DUF397 domain-containing protein [Streptosporangiaceae bacterium]|nr:DUF397 domain-containing protein [Streptosporangiaceae bacterium]
MDGYSILTWRKSTYSGGNGGQCVEVAASGRVLVRDGKAPDRGPLGFSAQTWREFAARIKSNDAS